ncbi:MAG: RHS repeat-associated core domain-containing protein, partial [Anaerolineae bacterium]
QRIALRVNGVVRWLATDHLGSTALTASETGGRLSEIRYKPWGESRGIPFGATPTQRRFTGQVLDEVAGGLYFYNARYYDPTLARFTQGDTIVPGAGNPQNLNRYSYVGNNPLRYTDPAGLCAAAPWGAGVGDRAQNMNYQPSCWGVYYNLLDQGIPGLDWQWDYATGQSVDEFAAANFATGSGSILGLAGALSYAGQDITGYLLLMVGGNVALINGSPTYYMYVNETAAYDAETNFLAFSPFAGHCIGTCPLMTNWLRERHRPAGMGGRKEKLVPFTVASDLAVASFTWGAHDYINETSYVYSGAAYLDVLWDISGLAAFGHSGGTFKWATAGLVDYAKLARSGIGSARSIGGIAASLAVEPVKISDLAGKLRGLPSH